MPKFLHIESMSHQVMNMERSNAARSEYANQRIVMFFRMYLERNSICGLATAQDYGAVSARLKLQHMRAISELLGEFADVLLNTPSEVVGDKQNYRPPRCAKPARG